MITIFITIAFYLLESLGCGIGYGYLHRIPIRDESLKIQPPIMPTPKADAGFSEVSLVGDTTPTSKQTG